jgi:hypothetical protein
MLCNRTANCEHDAINKVEIRERPQWLERRRKAIGLGSGEVQIPAIDRRSTDRVR